MPGEANETVTRAAAAVNRSDLESFLAELHPDIVWDWSRSVGPFKGVYRGREGVRRLIDGMFEAFDDLRWDPQEVIEVSPDCVVLVNRMSATGRGSGVEVSAIGAQVWRLADGKCVLARLYQNREDALEALRAEGYEPGVAG